MQSSLRPMSRVSEVPGQLITKVMMPAHLRLWLWILEEHCCSHQGKQDNLGPGIEFILLCLTFSEIYHSWCRLLFNLEPLPSLSLFFVMRPQSPIYFTKYPDHPRHINFSFCLTSHSKTQQVKTDNKHLSFHTFLCQEFRREISWADLNWRLSWRVHVSGRPDWG